MLFILDEFTIINTNEIAKVTLVRDKTHGWIVIRNDERPIRITTGTYNKLVSLIKSRGKKDIALPLTNPNVSHKYVKDGIDTCACGKLDSDTIHKQ